MKKKGSALLIVIIIMATTFMMAALILDFTLKNNKASVSSGDSLKSYYCAETGISDMINYAKEKFDNKTTLSTTTSLSNYYTQGNNSILFQDPNAYYTANISSIVNTSTTTVGADSLTDYSFQIQSTGMYNEQEYIIIVLVILEYKKDITSGNYLYYRYYFTSRQVNKS